MKTLFSSELHAYKSFYKRFYFLRHCMKLQKQYSTCWSANSIFQSILNLDLIHYSTRLQKQNSYHWLALHKVFWDWKFDFCWCNTAILLANLSHNWYDLAFIATTTFVKILHVCSFSWPKYTFSIPWISLRLFINVQKLDIISFVRAFLRNRRP